MKIGAILDNVQTSLGETVPQSSIDKLAAMGAGVVGTLWTAGTKHGRDVYERCEAALGKPLYIVRVGGHKEPPEEWMWACGSALAQLPVTIVDDDRALFVCGNEPNLEGYKDNPSGYGQLYAAVKDSFDKPILFACPSLGVSDWREYLTAAVNAAGYPIRNIIINAYAHLVYEVGNIAQMCGAERVYIGEVNTLNRREARTEYFQNIAWPHLQAAGVEAALVFIAGGQSGGAWDERYIVEAEEAAGLKWTGQEVAPMEWTLGFADYAKANAYVGTPVEGLQYDDHGNAWQHSDAGLLFWHKADNLIHWFGRPKA